MMPRVEGTPGDPFDEARTRSRARRAADRTRREQGRKRLVLLGGTAAVAALAGVVVGAGGGGGDGGTKAATGAGTKPVELPGGGRTLFPGHRVIALYGTSGTPVLGDLGRGTPTQAAARLRAKLPAYRTARGPKVLPAFEFIGTVAARAPGPDGAYRTFRPAADVRRYLKAVRAIGGIFVLDVQPGRADFLDEVKHYQALLEEPDVSLALDPEWKMGPDEIPGQVIGHTDAATVNGVSAWLAGIVRERHLPQKLLVIHQFTAGMVQNRAQVLSRPGVAVTFNVDGFGTQAVKRERFRALHGSRPFFTGFKLFLTQDADRLKPAAVMGFRPPVLFIDYQ
jgi:hypothetical protein